LKPGAHKGRITPNVIWLQKGSSFDVQSRC